VGPLVPRLRVAIPLLLLQIIPRLNIGSHEDGIGELFTLLSRNTDQSWNYISQSKSQQPSHLSPSTSSSGPPSSAAQSTSTDWPNHLQVHIFLSSFVDLHCAPPLHKEHHAFGARRGMQPVVAQKLSEGTQQVVRVWQHSELVVDVDGLLTVVLE
jgi:hypothetical protein